MQDPCATQPKSQVLRALGLQQRDIKQECMCSIEYDFYIPYRMICENAHASSQYSQIVINVCAFTRQYAGACGAMLDEYQSGNWVCKRL